MNDKEPEIWLEDQSEACRELARTLGWKRPIRKIIFGDDFSAFIPTSYIAKHRWRLIRARKRQEVLLRKQGEEYLALNVMLMCFMMDHCVRADSRKNSKESVNGMFRSRLIKVGCRIEKTQDEIADMFKAISPDCTREWVNKQINLMHDLGIIVSKGRGWCEFDVELCWNGAIDHWLAYREVQKSQYDAVIVMPDGAEVRLKNFMRPLDALSYEDEKEAQAEEDRWAQAIFKERAKQGLDDAELY